MYEKKDGSVVYEHDETASLNELFVGRRIVSALTNRDGLGVFTLDNGVTLELRPNEGCGGCDSGWYALDHTQKFDHVITNVEVDWDDNEDCETVYTLYVYAESAQSAVATVSGSDGNGWYGTGFEIIARKPA